MSQITRRHLLQLSTMVLIPDISMAAGKHVSAEKRTQLSQALGESVGASWKLFQSTSNAQVLAVSRAQLYLIQQSHATLDPGARPFLYAGIYNLIGTTFHFQRRDREALQAYHRAYVAALATKDPWYIAANLINQADSYQALNQHDTAIQMLREALHLIGQPTHEALVRLKAHLLTCWADNAMMLGDYRTAQAQLAAAEEYLDQIPLNEEFDRAGWLLLTGKYGLITKDHSSAIRSFEEALTSLPASWLMRRAMTATGLAIAYARLGERDSSLAVAEYLVPTLQTINAPMTNRWFTEYLQQDLLGLFPRERSVRTFLRDTYGRLPQLTNMLAGVK